MGRLVVAALCLLAAACTDAGDERATTSSTVTSTTAPRVEPAPPVTPPARPELVTDAEGPVRVPVRGATADVHDPAIAKEGDTYYLYFTHGGIQVRTSTDLVSWREVPEVFADLPAWVARDLPDNPDDLWAPDISWWGGKWHLYYSASVWIDDPTRNSSIGHATNVTLDPADPRYEWVDHGPVVESRGPFVGATDTTGWNAIDAAVVLDEVGDPWLTWGSGFDGIFIQALTPDGTLDDRAAPINLARRGAYFSVVEASQIIRHGGAWWLFTSYDLCCQGLRSNYSVRVGRSDSLTGPYVDRAGASLISPRDGTTALSDDPGELVLRGYGEIYGPGHQFVFADGDTWWLVHHWYDPARNGAPDLGIRPLVWGDDGWPVAQGWSPSIPAPNAPGTTTTRQGP